MEEQENLFIEFGPVASGIFLERPNRFVALVKMDGQSFFAHVPTSGRLRELLLPGTPVLLEASRVPGRSTSFDLRAVSHGDVWVSVDARLPNRLLEAALKAEKIKAFARCRFIRREPAYAGGRLDFELRQDGRPVYIEVKSVTLVENGMALFPDAPTVRGTRHLQHLACLAKNGYRSAVIFAIQRGDARSFAPNSVTDPGFARALHEAVSSGVEAYAFSCPVTPQGIRLGERLPVLV